MILISTFLALLFISIANSSTTFGSFNATNATINTRIQAASYARITSCSGLCPLLLMTPTKQGLTALFQVNDDGQIWAMIQLGGIGLDSNIFWSSNTGGKGKGPFRLYAQNDGNLVLYDSKNKVIWASNTEQPKALHGRHTLTLTYCNVTLTSPRGNILWIAKNYWYCPTF